MPHISVRLSDEQVSTILTQYEEDKISAADAQAKLSVKPSRFFDYLKRFRKDAATFTIARPKRSEHSRISEDANASIKKELEVESALIKNPDMPIRFYNYSAVRDVLKETHKIKVSLPTIISRAKELGFYIPKPERKKHELSSRRTSLVN